MNLWGYHHLAYHLDKRLGDHGGRNRSPCSRTGGNPASFDHSLCVTVPGADLLAQLGAIDDPMKGQMNAMVADPERTGERHADWWAEWLKPLGVPTDRLYCCPLNEQTQPLQPADRPLQRHFCEGCIRTICGRRHVFRRSSTYH